MNRRPLRRRIPLSLLRRTPWPEQKPTWREASPARIAAALERATARPAGNWYVVGSSRGIRPGRPYGRTVAGTEIVLWRDADGALRAAPGSCPHLGAPLCDAVVAGGELEDLAGNSLLRPFEAPVGSAPKPAAGPPTFRREFTVAGGR